MPGPLSATVMVIQEFGSCAVRRARGVRQSRGSMAPIRLAATRMVPPCGSASSALQQQVEKELAELLVIGLDHQRPAGHFAMDLHSLPLGAGMNQLQRLLDAAANVSRLFRQRGRAGEIEKRLQQSLQPRRLRFQNAQVAVGQSAWPAAPSRHSE